MLNTNSEKKIVAYLSLAYAQLLSRMSIYFYIVIEIESSEPWRKLVSDLFLELPLEFPFMLPLFPHQEYGLGFVGNASIVYHHER